jgi:hypothetical protein
LLLSLRQLGFRLGQIFFGRLQGRRSLIQLGVVIVALGDQRIDMVAHLKNVQCAGGQGRKYGHNQNYAHPHGAGKLITSGKSVNAGLRIVKSSFDPACLWWETHRHPAKPRP